MAVRTELLLLASLLLASSCRASELVPFIAWSNSDVLSSLRTDEDLNEIAQSLSERKSELTVLFVTKELSFDDVAKYGGVFGEGSESALSGLKTAVKKAESQYWSGVSPLDTTWILEFSHRLGEKAVFVDPSSTLEPENWRGLVIVDLSDLKDYAEKDTIVRNVMNDLEEKEMSYLAIFTRGSSQDAKETNSRARLRRSADLEIRQSNSNDSGNSSGSGNYNSSSDCPIGVARGGCFLFCLEPPIIFTPNISTNKTCNLTTPDRVVDYGCGNDPYLTLNFSVPNGTTLTNNTCENGTLEGLVTDLGWDFGPPYTLVFTFKFAFTAENSSAYYAYYFMTINTTITSTAKGSLVENSSDTVMLERQHPPNLYENFTVPLGLSYACSANQTPYNQYADRSFSGLVFDSPSLNLTGIQVQPFDVQGTTFASAYNCIGYFTEATWMGIFTVIILLIVFYLSIVCTFSMKTVDRFEDPRGQTILVEKLH